MANNNMDLLVRILGDGSGMETGFAKAASFAKGQFTALAGFFASKFTVESIIGNFEKALNFANTIKDNAEATGVGVESLQALNVAAERAGAYAATKLLFPLILFIMPAVFVVIFGPIALNFIYGNMVLGG